MGKKSIVTTHKAKQQRHRLSHSIKQRHSKIEESSLLTIKLPSSKGKMTKMSRRIWKTFQHQKGEGLRCMKIKPKEQSDLAAYGFHPKGPQKSPQNDEAEHHSESKNISKKNTPPLSRRKKSHSLQTSHSKSILSPHPTSRSPPSRSPRSYKKILHWHLLAIHLPGDLTGAVLG